MAKNTLDQTDFFRKKNKDHSREAPQLHHPLPCLKDQVVFRRKDHRTRHSGHERRPWNIYSRNMVGLPLKTEEKPRGQEQPSQNLDITNMSHRSEGFHVLEIHAPTLESGLGTVMMIVTSITVLLVYQKYCKRLSEVKRLKEAAKQTSQQALPLYDRLPQVIPVPHTFTPWSTGQIQTLPRMPTSDLCLATLLAGVLQSSGRSTPLCVTYRWESNTPPRSSAFISSSGESPRSTPLPRRTGRISFPTTE